MARGTRRTEALDLQQRHNGALADAVARVREGEHVLALIDPAAHSRDPQAFGEWLSARLAIGELPRLLLPACDERCASIPHQPERFVVLSDLAIDAAEPRPASWWHAWNETLQREFIDIRTWFAGSPALPATSARLRLRTGTLLTRVTATDPFLVHYEGAQQETLFRIASGPRTGELLIAVTFGPSPLLPALAGVLVAQDHPPARDRAVAVRLLAAGWAAVERGLPHED